MRKLLLLLVFALVVAACGGADESAPATTAAQAASPSNDDATTASPPSTTAAGEAGTETTAPSVQSPSFDGPPAPDFALALADGSTFDLSDEQKPVYVVFWAEW